MLVVLRFAPTGIPALMGGRGIGGGTGGRTDSDRPGKAGGGERGPGRAPGREKDGRWALRASSAGVWGRGSEEEACFATGCAPQSSGCFFEDGRGVGNT